MATTATQKVTEITLKLSELEVKAMNDFYLHLTTNVINDVEGDSQEDLDNSIESVSDIFHELSNIEL